VGGRCRAHVRRSAGGGFGATGLPQPQGEMLRLVGRQPGISVREAATELGLVANTASTLVSKGAAEGLLIRTVDSADPRTADESRAARRAALSTVRDELDRSQLESLERGLEVLAEVTRMLHE